MRTGALCLVLMTGGLLGCGGGSSSDGEPAPPPEPTIEDVAALAETFAPLEADCDLGPGAEAAAEVVELLERVDPTVMVSGRSLEQWQALASSYESIGRRITDEAAFMEFWRDSGGSFETFQHSDVSRRAAQGDPGAIDELKTTYEGSSLVSMTLSAAGSAVRAGNTSAADALLATLDLATLEDGNKAAYAARLLELDRVDEAEAMLAGLGTGLNFDSGTGGVLLVHFIQQDGVELGLARMTDLAMHPALALTGAVTEYQRDDGTEALAALLGSPTAADLVATSDGMMSAGVVVAMERSVGSEAAIAVLDRLLSNLADQEEHTRQFQLGALVDLLARAGCSDACLAATVDPIREEAAAGGRWTEILAKAMAASGDLDAAIAASEDPAELLKSATEFAAGRHDPAYVLPLLKGMNEAQRQSSFGSLINSLLWAEAPPETITTALKLAGTISDPGPWNMAAGLAVYADYLPEETKQGVRKGLLFAVSGGCPVEPDTTVARSEAS